MTTTRQQDQQQADAIAQARLDAANGVVSLPGTLQITKTRPPIDVVAVLRQEATLHFANGRPVSAATLNNAADAVAALIHATRRLRNFVDVSTIRPGKRVGAGWDVNVKRVDAALADVGGAK